MLQDISLREIQKEKEELKKKWEFHQEYMLHMMQEALHWQSSSESYDSLVRDYYIARQKHQKDVMRLNQILYGPDSAKVQAYSNDTGDMEEMVVDQGSRQPLRERMDACSNSYPQDHVLFESVTFGSIGSRKRKDFSPAGASQEQDHHKQMRKTDKNW
ncbi:hypothetical protein M9435_000558 [Picochlorum sp. BPE23]|nr:hypothetical protein M9435_000558 [Picochlorum sp. BPE23]